jgi:hypothetical protein
VLFENGPTKLSGDNGDLFESCYQDKDLDSNRHEWVELQKRRQFCKKSYKSQKKLACEAAIG